MHEPEFTVAVETGMRLFEQYSMEWPRVHFNRRQIQLVATKNGSSGNLVPSNDAVEVLKVCESRRSPHTPRVFLTRYSELMEDPQKAQHRLHKRSVELNSAGVRSIKVLPQP